MAKLTGKTALITGAGRGIGRATAELFAAEGADLAILARTESELTETADLCRSEGAEVFSRVCDLGKPAQIDAFMLEMPERFARIDILINNAARFDKGMFAEFPRERFELMIQANIVGTFYLTQQVLGRMPQGGSIINISSLSGIVGFEKFPGFGAYNVSKYALWGLTEILAVELAERGIRVNQIAPSGVETKMFREAVPPGVSAEMEPEHVAAEILRVITETKFTGENILFTELPK
ncbi:MAG: SDR family oxidoreductase [bacterium]